MFARCRVTICRSWLLVLCFWAVGFPPVSIATAADVKGRLVIVTSFPERLFNRYKTAFELVYPKVKVHVRSRKTSAAISFIQERTHEPVDLFWASAPDAFEVLKQSRHLRRLSDKKRLSHMIGRSPVDDPDGYYRGFAISGYGLMWNREYFAARNLTAPTHWADLTRPEYFRHVGITAPSRSGTTHLIVETILQAEGWNKGWATLLEMGGNLATVTARSFGVPDGIRSGRFGIGPVIDFFGLGAIADGAPVEFYYPDKTAFLPANIAIVSRVANLGAAHAFIEFIRSEAGQKILFEPAIRRLPIRPGAYGNAPAGYPDPFNEELVKRGIAFDRHLSRQRYHLVNSLFDTMITYRLRALNRVWGTIHKAEAMLSGNTPPVLRQRLERAKQLARDIPVDEKEAREVAFGEIFRHRKPGLPLPPEQIRLQQEWEKFARNRQNKAMELSTGVLTELSSLKESQ
jgi:phosphoglycerate transport regulatory protein PgtC